MASDSKVARRTAASDYQAALHYAADLLHQQARAAAAQQASHPGQTTPPAGAGATYHEPSSPNASRPAAAAPPKPSVSSVTEEHLSSHQPAPAALQSPPTTATPTWAAAPPIFAAQGLVSHPAAVTAAAVGSASDAAAQAAALPGALEPHAPTPASARPTAHVMSSSSEAATAAATSQPAAAEAVASRAVVAPGGPAVPSPPAGPAAIAAVTDPPTAGFSRAAAVSASSAVDPGGSGVDPNARLPSVHDDMVVAAIASSGWQPAAQAGGAPGGPETVTGAETSERQAEQEQAATASSARAYAQPQAHGQAQAPPQQQPARKLRERRVPETPLGRALGFAGLGASLLMGSIADNVTRAIRGPSAGGGAAGGAAGHGGGSGGATSFLTEANAERLANALCRMRGAALKIGQMLSIQDESVLPPQVQAALERVRAGADVMPRSQLEGVLVSELGPHWQDHLEEFEWEPRAAASIGQVHTAVLKDGRRVAMKIQYPGVARSIESDVDNLMRLIAVANVLPRGLYVENAARVAKRELAMECDYTYELSCQQRYKALIAADPQLAAHFHVPDVVPGLSSARILTSEWVSGVPIDKVRDLSQSVRDAVGTRLLQLTLRELFEWRFMQTDPNWGNFLYDQETDKLNLIDFGASKDYPESFVSDYMRMVAACAERDRQGVVDMSVKLGFLTGDESEVMLEAHTQAGFVVGVPFAAPGLYDFGSHGGMTSRVSELGAVMLKHRLTPPPQDSYSLHRKLSGAFLACMKLKARVPCRELFFRTYDAVLGPLTPPRMAADSAAAAAVVGAA